MRYILLSIYIEMVEHQFTRDGGRSPQASAGPLADGLRWETDRYPMQRELGYRVYLVGYGGKREREGEKKERQFLPLQKKGRQRERERKRERGGRTAGRGRLGMGGGCLLKGQGTQVTD